ncbi:MAG: FkbM family methyltransferase [Xanthobacteraceae bacterium]
MTTELAHFGALQPGFLDRAIIALTSAMPNNRLGLRLAILLRKLVTLRLTAGALDVARWGLNMRLHPLDNGCEKNLLFTPQMYEPDELAELASEIARVKDAGRPFVFVDIGANVGLFSLFVAAKAGQGTRIVAVEPEPGNFERLSFNIASNGALPITPVAMALGDAAVDVAIALNRRDRGGTRVQPLATADAQTSVRVPCKPLLALLREHDVAAIDALKIDVEGMEDKVLVPFFRDAPPSLWPRMILIEDSSHEWKADLFGLFKEKGYAISLRTKQNVVLRRP